VTKKKWSASTCRSTATDRKYRKADRHATRHRWVGTWRHPYEQLRENPYTVLLLDEVEKASPYLMNLFLQAFDEGWLTDGRGKKVYLSDAIIIMTSTWFREFQEV
jgi:MoxR-like ATPase